MILNHSHSCAEEDPVGHVTIDVNPAYMIVKKVNLTDNSAYGTSASLQQPVHDYEYIVSAFK